MLAHTPQGGHVPKTTNTRSTRKAATRSASPRSAKARQIPFGVNEATIPVDGGDVHLTNLSKIFWPGLRLTKRDLLQYYLDVSPWLLPHLQNRAMVMKRYPNGIDGEFFFMKRAPIAAPASIPICSIEHHSGNVIDFPSSRTSPRCSGSSISAASI